MLNSSILQNLLGGCAQAIPARHVDDHAHVGREESGLNAVLQEAVPLQVVQTDLSPTSGVDHAALQTSVNLRRWDAHGLSAENVFKERVVHGVRTQAECGHIQVALSVQLGLVHGVEVVRNPAVEPAEVIDPHFLLVDLVHQVNAAIASGMDGVGVGRHQRIALRNRSAIKARGGVGHVDHTVANRVGLLGQANHFRTATDVDLHDAGTLFVHLLDEFQEALCVDQRRGKGVHR